VTVLMFIRMLKHDRSWLTTYTPLFEASDIFYDVDVVPSGIYLTPISPSPKSIYISSFPLNAHTLMSTRATWELRRGS